MAGPPPNVEPTELWLRLTQRPRPFTVIDFPPSKLPGGKPTDPIGKVAIRVLTEHELHECMANAQRAAKEYLKGDTDAKQGNLGYEDIYRNELTFELIYNCCRDPNDINRPVFLHPKLTRKFLTTDELAVLLDAYHLFRSESGPIISEMTVEEMDAWIAKLREGGSRVPLARLSGEAKSDLILYLLEKLSTLTGSAGSPPGSTSSMTSDGEASNVLTGPDLV